MIKNRVTFLITVFPVIMLAGCSVFPRATVDYSGLGQTRLDRELKSHWQSGTELLGRDIQEIVDLYSV